MIKKKIKLPPKRYSPDINSGLSYDIIKERRTEKLTNMREVRTSKSYTHIIFKNVFTLFNMLWFLIAAVLIYIGSYGDCFFLVIVLANLFIGVFQEIKAKRTVDKLSLLTAPTATVLREGREGEIPATDVVLDDIFKLTMGKQICCDSIVKEGSLEVNESMLTGESLPVKKNPGDTLFAGSFVTSGTCYAQVEHVGSANYIQKLSKKAKSLKKPASQLLKSLNLLINIIAALIIPLGTIVVLRNYRLFNGDMYMVITKSAGALVGMIPSGMFLLTSVALAVGIIRLAANRTLVQDLYSIEMLARTTTLCLDKTGTITDGTMTVKEVITIKNHNIGIAEIVSSVLCATKDNNQTAEALINRFKNKGCFHALEVMPFSSARKYSAATFADLGTYALGAAEYMFSDIPKDTAAIINEKSVEGYRVLCVAHSPNSIENEKIPKDMKPLFIILLEDHIREDALDTIKWFKENDVKIKIISGDNPITVSVIARRVGIENADKYLSLDKLSDEEVTAAATRYTVFGRVTPEQKAILVRALKRAGETVAMTGDGVNDILALKESDCSVAMAAGSEAARNVSSLVLLDSNFSCMTKVVNEGRRVINNIQKTSSMFLMKTFFIIMLVPLLALIPIAVYPYPFTPKQMMLLEILVVGMPAFFLALQPSNVLITGKFLVTVIKKAMPPAIVLLFNILFLYAFGYFFEERFGVPYSDIVTMCIYCTTFAGFEMLAYVCYKFNLYRTVLFFSMFALSILLLLVMPGFFDLTSLSLLEIGIAAGLIVVDFPALLLLQKLSHKIKIK